MLLQLIYKFRYVLNIVAAMFFVVAVEGCASNDASLHRTHHVLMQISEKLGTEDNEHPWIIWRSIFIFDDGTWLSTPGDFDREPQILVEDTSIEQGVLPTNIKNLVLYDVAGQRNPELKTVKYTYYLEAGPVVKNPPSVNAIEEFLQTIEQIKEK